MRALMQVAAAAVAMMGVNVAEQVQRGPDDFGAPRVGRGSPGGKKKRMSAEHYKKHDPFYGIPSKGRCGAASRMQRQVRAHTEGRTRVGTRSRPCRDEDRNFAGPPFISKNRNKVFIAAIAAGQSRNESLKIARRAEARAMLSAYPQCVPPPLLSWGLTHCNDIIRQSPPDEVIGRGMLGEPYMERWHLLRKNEQSGIENIYLHRFVRSDPEDLHDHPWANASIVLAGRYVEQSWTLDGRRTDTRGPGDIVIRAPEDRHAITGVEPGTVTLFITGPKVREWGFWLDDQFVHWLEYRALKHRERDAA